MKSRIAFALPCCLLLAHCSDKGGRIDTRLAAATMSTTSTGAVPKIVGGAATAAQLASLKYQIRSISICESMDVAGSGFSNPQNCLELYRNNAADTPYDLNGDWTPLANDARRSDTGFIDLLNATSRQQLANTTAITEEHVRSYNYGYITWSLPLKVTAEVAMGDGSSLYTHDGVTETQTVGVDNYRAYYTRPAVSLSVPPAEEAVVLLPNGGNWFKFQSPFVITASDIDERRAFVLDLVFNPDGIIKGFRGARIVTSLRETDAMGGPINAISVPMLDLAPVPHRASEQVMRESYRGTVTLDNNSFDLRIELYYLEGDTSGTVYGVDVKSLVNAQTTDVPSDVAKIAFVDRAADGSLTLSGFSHRPVFTGLNRVAGASGSTRVGVVCGTHSDRAAAEGGAAVLAQSCPQPVLDVPLTLVARTAVTGGVSAGVGTPDAGARDGGTP